MIRINCPACGRECEFADFLGGLTAVCKNCGHRIPVPAGDAIQPAAGIVLPQAPPTPPPSRLSADAIQSAPGAALPPPAPAVELPEDRPVVNDPAALSPQPDWAIEHAAASLRLGLSVPEIEQRLVARGLSPTAAAAVVTAVLEDRVRDRFEPADEGERGQLVHRTLSGVVACACLLLAYWYGEGYSVWRTVLSTLGPLACIWVPDVMAALMRSDAAAVGIRLLGWVLLLLICGYRVVLVLTVAS